MPAPPLRPLLVCKPHTELGSPGSACTGRAGCRTARGCPRTSYARRAPARSPQACWQSRPGRRRAPCGNSWNRADVPCGSKSDTSFVLLFLETLRCSSTQNKSLCPGLYWTNSACKQTFIDPLGNGRSTPLNCTHETTRAQRDGGTRQGPWLDPGLGLWQGCCSTARGHAWIFSFAFRRAPRAWTGELHSHLGACLAWHLLH